MIKGREVTNDDIMITLSQFANGMNGRVEALEADIKEVYRMLSVRNKGDASFSHLSLEKKLLTLNINLLATAEEAGIVLPR